MFLGLEQERASTFTLFKASDEKRKEQRLKSLYKKVIEELLYRDQRKGVSLMEVMSIKNYTRYMFSSIVTFLRFNLYNDMLMYYSLTPRTTFCEIVLMASIGYISFGYFIKKKFKGREVMAFCLLIMVSLPFDLIVLGFRLSDALGQKDKND